MKVGYLITARLKSTRLPKKVLLEVGGRPFLTQMIHRLRNARSIDEIIICTSTNRQDDPLEELSLAEGVVCFRGDEEDVIRRLWGACKAHGLDYALNITADCPLVDPRYADRIVEEYRKTGADLIRSFGLPHGAFSYGLKPEALGKVVDIKDDDRTEVWGRYFTDTDLFDVHDLPIDSGHRWPELRMTLDYPEDYDFFKALWAGLETPVQDATIDEILEYLRNHPEIIDINRDCATRFRKRFNSQAGIRLKARHDVSRAVVIGAGSIGQRHIRNLRHLGITDIAALRTRNGHAQALPEELDVDEISSWEEVRRFDPNVAIIANPTALHLESVERIMPFVRGVFIEKPLADSLSGIPEILETAARRRVVTFMGYNLQFHPIAEKIAEALQGEEIGAALSVQMTVGHWLPDWHPYEDFRKSYAARKELGGGVALTLIHEIQLVMSWLGPVEGVTAIFPGSDSLPLDVDVRADFMLAHSEGCVSQLHLDFVQNPYHREGIVSCERGSLRYDVAAGRLEVSCSLNGQQKVLWDEPDYDGNSSYLQMMETFLRYVREGRVRHEMDAWRGAESLAVVMAGRRSAESGSTAIPQRFVDGW
ncbi:MAG: Gfo/Idh/MocA family oxidoreductase [Thermoanaerobaculales bacterium]|nr:Gfo/Idh/MocA family oxidoreductase [Thermoanaerobaculales bacterium]